MTDHLAEARGLATDVYYEDDDTLARQQTSKAIEALADAIEELRAQDRDDAETMRREHATGSLNT